MEKAMETEKGSQLEGIPLLGAFRRHALVDSGIETRAALESATMEQIAAVKGIGLGNALKIKAWLSAQAITENTPPIAPILELTSIIPTVTSDSGSSTYQQLQENLVNLHSVLNQMQSLIPKKEFDLKLAGQMEKVLAVAAELSADMKSFKAKRQERAAKSLDDILSLLKNETERGKLSQKRQTALREQLRARRLLLEKVISG